MIESNPVSLVVIAGPTASGKTSIALELASKFDAEIVGADSMQVFRGLDIGTAKPSAGELGSIAHHLIDVAKPHESFDASRFVKEADEVIKEIVSRKKRIIVAGGTGLYIRALLHGLHQAPPPDPAIRARIMDRAEQLGWPSLHEELGKVDPQTYQKLHPNDGVRIVRALEVLESSGKTMSQWQKEHGFAKWRYRSLILGIDLPRDCLNKRINLRVDQMMKAGFLKEVKKLIEAGVDPLSKPMQGLGYKRLIEHLDDKMSLDEAIEQIKTDTRRFAKRQITWFKKEPGLQWIEPDGDVFWTRTSTFFNNN